MTHNGHRTLWTFAITSLALFMTTLDNLVVTMALPTIQRNLHASISGLEWTVNAYTLTFAVLLLMGAALGDRFGRKRMFLIGMAIFTIGSASGGAGTVDRRADRRSGGAGSRRRDRHPAHADAADRGGPARAARPRARRVGRHQRPGRRARPARRRRRRRGHLVAVDLLAERPARPAGAADGPGPAAREPRAVDAARPARAWRSSPPARSGSCGASCGPTRRAGRAPEIVASLAAGAVAARRVRRLGAARAGADAAACGSSATGPSRPRTVHPC